MFKMRTRFAVVIGLLCGHAASGWAAQDLLHIYQRAALQDPQLASAQAATGGAEARYRQARGQLLPNLSGSASFSKLKSIDKSDDDGSPFGAGTGGTGGAMVPPDTSDPDFEDQQALNLNLRQPIFNWSAFQAKDAAAARSEVALAELSQARQSLIVRSAQRYFDVLAAKEALYAAQQQQELISRQLDRAKASFESGLIPITDSLEAQSELDRTRVDDIEARNQLRQARNALSQLIGSVPGELAPVAAPVKPAPPEEPADDWVSSGLLRSPNVAAAQLRLKASEQEISQAWGGHYPTLDFVARLGQTEQSFNFIGSVRTTVTATQSFGVELSVPLFAGFTVNAQIDEAEYAAQQARQDLIAAQRQVSLDVQTAYGDLQAAVARIDALGASIKSGKAAAEAAKAGLQTGTRNILDVLQADLDLVQRKADLKQAWYDYLLAELRLRQAAGVLSEANLRQVNARLQVDTATPQVP